MASSKVVIAHAAAYLDRLELGYICEKMCSRHYPLPRWQPELVAVCQRLYKRFLWLMIHYPNEVIVPTRDIDEFWHNHILYTKNYSHDCQILFGHYKHHIPSDPNNATEMATISQHFQRTKEIYQQEFDEPLKVLQRSGSAISQSDLEDCYREANGEIDRA